MAKPTAVLYAQPGCGRCTAVKDLLSELGIDFEEKDTLNDLQALEELEHRGSWEAPITLNVGDFVLKLDTQQLQEFLSDALE
jgi:glutaredoxin